MRQHLYDSSLASHLQYGPALLCILDLSSAFRRLLGAMWPPELCCSTVWYDFSPILADLSSQSICGPMRCKYRISPNHSSGGKFVTDDGVLRSILNWQKVILNFAGGRDGEEDVPGHLEGYPRYQRAAVHHRECRVHVGRSVIFNA